MAFPRFEMVEYRQLAPSVPTGSLPMSRFVVALLTFGFVTVLHAAPPPVTALAYRGDGQILAAGTRGEVVLVNPANGAILGELPGQTVRVTGLAFSKTGTLAVASGEPSKSGIVRLYATSEPTKVPEKPTAEFTAHKDIIYGLAFSPDGRTLATAGYDRIIKLWDVPPKPTPRLTLTDHSDTVYSLAFSPDGSLLASGAADRAVKVWDTVTGKRLYTLSDPTDWVYAVTWAPTGNRLAAGGVDRSIRIWEATASGGKLLQSAFAHEKPVSRLLFTADGTTLYSVGEDRVVKAWDSKQLNETKVFPAQPDTVLSAALRPDGKQLAFGRFDGVVQLIDPVTAKPTATPLPVKPKPPTATRLTPDNVIRGKTARVVVEGTALDTVTAVKSSDPSVTVKRLADGRSRTRLELELTATATASVGAVSLTFTGPGGDSSPTRFWVDRFPVIPEQGNTDAARTGMTVTLPATVIGRIDRAGDTDFFRFSAETGQRIGVQLVTVTDGAKFEPVLVLADDTGTELTENPNGRLGFVCPKAGIYAIGVRDREFRGGTEYGYRLHVGPVPVVTGVFPLGMQRGFETTAHISGVNLGEPVRQTVKVKPPITAAPGSRFPLPITRTGGDPIGPVEVVVGEFPSVVVVPGTGATLRAIPGTADGILNPPGEAGIVRFSAKKGERLIVEVDAARIGSPVDSFLEILDANGKPVPRATLRCTAKTFVTFRDHDSTRPGIRLEYWNELAMNDYLFVDGELMRIKALPRGPDDDCQFFDVENKRIGYLGTTPKQHAFGTTMYKVEMHPPGSTFPPNGMPLIPIFYRNDDGGPRMGKDSRLVFDAPADGLYQLRVSDSTGASGPTHAYRVTVRQPRPDFTLAVTPMNPTVWRGGAVPFTVTATRIDDFDGPIEVKATDWPLPFRFPATIIEAGQLQTTVALAAGTEPMPTPVPPFKLTGTATMDGKPITREVSIGVPTITPAPDIVTTTNVQELTIRPGQESRITVTIERQNKFTGRVPVEVRGLPHGVRVLNVGLNGILVLPTATKREIVLFCEPWVKPMDQPIVILARREGKSPEFAAPSVRLQVRE